ncbi:Crp/Fnr family transcriptional regulator [Paenibacillus gansuensis]|uniref:Crp/Fnr family transcriptional regulator n=1 Tax=Paenibacillus gansuensis TaxID=306542 RepID=A0ABW5PL95_9BACL
MEQISHEQIQYIVSRFPSLKDISTEDWGMEGITVMSMPPAEVIHEGQILEHAALILDGTVRIYKVGKSGREVTLYRVNDGECCPLMMSSILGESEYEASAAIEKQTTLLFLPIGIFRIWMDKYKNFRQFIFQMFARRIIIMSNLLDNINFKSIRSRIAEYLYERTSENSDAIATTHDTMSIELGTAREVISRALKGMENEGLLQLSRGKVTHIQRSRLKQLIE